MRWTSVLSLMSIVDDPHPGGALTKRTHHHHSERIGGHG
jgi:hypothetical protein